MFQTMITAKIVFLINAVPLFVNCVTKYIKKKTFTRLKPKKCGNDSESLYVFESSMFIQR